jgi:hypothetical protein
MEDAMNELSMIFGGDLTTENFYVSLIAFLLLYVAGSALLQRWNRTTGRIPAIRRHVISGVGAAVVTMAVGFGLHSENVTMASVRVQSGATTTTSISPQELQRAIGKSLPAQDFEDQTVIFTNRD